MVIEERVVEDVVGIACRVSMQSVHVPDQFVFSSTMYNIITAKKTLFNILLRSRLLITPLTRPVYH